MLRAIIFDFDGILVDSEPLIMKLIQEMAAREGWALSEDEYFGDYLALDDRGVIEHLWRTHGRPLSISRRNELLAWKANAYEKIIHDGLPAIPGAAEFVLDAANRFPLAIASGSLRAEIEHLLRKLGLREKFAVLATADDCERSKPDPEVYLKALSRLQELPQIARTGARTDRVPGHRGRPSRSCGRAGRRNEVPGPGPQPPPSRPPTRRLGRVGVLKREPGSHPRRVQVSRKIGSSIRLALVWLDRDETPALGKAKAP